MLKIRDNVDLKELEKFGFETIEDGLGYLRGYQKDYKTKKNIFIINIDNLTRQIVIFDWYNNKQIYNDFYIKDLVQAGLVEKVVEE